MKRILILLPLLFFLPLTMAHAANDVYMDDYYYAHAPAGASGTFPFTTKSGATSITFPEATQGINAYKANNTTHYKVRCEVGGEWKNVTVATGHLKADPKQKSYRCELETDGEVEAYGAVRWAGDVLHMETRYYLEGTPTNPGDGSDGTTGPGSGPGPGTDPGGKPFDKFKYYYTDWRDQYRLDFWGLPTNAKQVRLHFTASSGAQYDREWPIDEVGGTLYLTCNGRYQLQFLDSSGSVISTVDDLSTGQIQSPTCESYPDPYPRDDLGAEVTMPACTDPSPGSGLPKVTWTGVPGAESYDIYKDGQKIGSTTDTEYDLPGDGSYTIIGRDRDGNPVGESDVNTPWLGTGGDSVADAICKCIEDLKPVLEEIRDNTQPIHDDLQLIHGDLLVTNDQLQQANGSLREIIRQLTPTREYQLPKPIVKPDLYDPGDVMDRPYQNQQTYFRDAGDAATPDAMPAAPEPKNWEHDGVRLHQDSPITPDPVMKRDEDMKKEPDMRREPDMQLDEVLTPDPEMVQDNPLQMQDEEYKLRWKSSEYP
ncbi:hypothetical protein [Paenibacillus thiaminolyticus]|uniref:Uncharacterized protein n=1 Tax=Paenibacillus thiaminolyticus TaxID=49283 RepID=A0A3A3GGH4_PANTH|nr:hypothetical protein [Paenibacillus thiaminolyticus]RJG23301.1 hypothetical protein DQX05_13715 [Paenibacillus thiaminolyticus]RJG23318.1 hypothetical protein DQX05_13805 [Paenibacillus thiaminolyticus]